MSGWSDDTIWWAVYPLGFLGASTRPADGRRPLEHRLPALEGWLDYLLSIGCNGLALGPIFESVSHGYDTLDHFRVDPRLGDEDDLAHLVAACHERGIRVALDGVFNHVSAAHPALLAALSGGPGSPTADMFHIDWSTNPPTRLNFEGSDDLVRLNHDSPAVRELVTRVMNHWLEFGVDAWRLDAAYAVPPSFWAPVLAEVRASHPRAFVWGGGHPRRLRADRRRLDDGLAHRVRAVEGHLEQSGRGELLRTRLDPRAAQRLRRGLRPDDLPRQPRHHPHRQPGGGREGRPGGRRAPHRRRCPEHLLR